MSNDGRLTLHATAVSVGERGLLIRGASGSGKSSLALEMIVRGAALVADDQVLLEKTAAGIKMSAPRATGNLIEARGVGLLWTPARPRATLVAVVDLDAVEKQRLPPHRSIEILERSVPLLHKVDSPAFPAALLLYLRRGRKDETE